MAADILSFADLWAWYDDMDSEQRSDILNQIGAGISKRPFESVQKILAFAPFEAVNRLWITWAYGYDLRVYQKVYDLAVDMAQLPNEVQTIVAVEWLRKTGSAGVKAVRGLTREEVKKINKLGLYKGAVEALSKVR